VITVQALFVLYKIDNVATVVCFVLCCVASTTTIESRAADDNDDDDNVNKRVDVVSVSPSFASSPPSPAARRRGRRSRARRASTTTTESRRRRRRRRRQPSCRACWAFSPSCVPPPSSSFLHRAAWRGRWAWSAVWISLLFSTSLPPVVAWSVSWSTLLAFLLLLLSAAGAAGWFVVECPVGLPRVSPPPFLRVVGGGWFPPLAVSPPPGGLVGSVVLCSCRVTTNGIDGAPSPLISAW